MAKKKRKFPYKEAALLGGSIGVLSAAAPSGAPAYVLLTPMAYHWYKTRGKLKRSKLRKVV